MTRRCAYWAAAFGMPTIVLALMLRRAVNVPFLDEWSWAPLSVALHRGTLAWPAIFAQHNEHRNVVGNLIFLAIDRTFGWNILAEQLVSFALLAAAQTAAWFLVRATVPPGRRLPLFAVLSLLVWSPAQWENFALGYNVGWNVCTAAVFAFLALLATRFGAGRLIAAAAVALLATFASAQGALLLYLGFELVSRNARSRIPALLAWSALTAVVLAAFLAGYRTVPPAGWPPVPTLALYFLTVLGTPIGAWWGVPACATVGALALAGFAWLALRGEREPREFALWSSAAVYAGFGALIIAATRSSFGPESALSSHYAAIALFLYVAIAGLVAANWASIARAPRWALLASGLLVAYGVLDAGLHGNRAWQLYAAARRDEICALARHDDAALVTLADADTAGVEGAAADLAAVGDLPYRAALPACAAATPERRRPLIRK